MTAAAASGWLTPHRHKFILKVALSLTATCYLSALGSRYFASYIGSTPAYHVAGGAMLFILVMWLASLVYTVLGSLRKSDRDIVWAGGITGSMTLGLIATLMCLLPATRVLQTQIQFDGLMSVSVDRTMLRIDGGISTDLAGRIEALDLHRVQVMALGDNNGGIVGGAIEALPVLQRAQLHTVVIDGRCASSCAILALMMPRRLIAPGAALGFHRLRPAAGGDSAATADTKRVRDRLLALGYAPAFVDKLFSTDELNWYSAEEARSLGLANGCWDPQQVREVPCS